MFVSIDCQGPTLQVPYIDQSVCQSVSPKSLVWSICFPSPQPILVHSSPSECLQWKVYSDLEQSLQIKVLLTMLNKLCPEHILCPSPICRLILLINRTFGERVCSYLELCFQVKCEGVADLYKIQFWTIDNFSLA